MESRLKVGASQSGINNHVYMGLFAAHVRHGIRQLLRAVARRAFSNWLFLGSLSISDFTAPFLELGCCGPRVVTNHAHTPPLEQQSSQGRLRLLNLSTISPQSTGNGGQKGLISTVRIYLRSSLNRFFNKSLFS
jgi:hypothetical protein